MRKASSLVALLLSVATAATARAQSAPAFGGIPGQLNYQVISTADPNLPVASPQTITSPTSPTRYINTSIGQISNTPVFGQSQFPSASQLPSDNYLKAFNVTTYQRRVPSHWYAPWTWF